MGEIREEKKREIMMIKKGDRGRKKQRQKDRDVVKPQWIGASLRKL
jgi:hypothetical protein